ncbi:MAG: KEOPS complex subunit Cgi121 [Candidatus Methanoperedens sp.]|nr:KEOPS complex subunit Cgi121 [Candidatus Methanoperedens sp.]
MIHILEGKISIDDVDEFLHKIKTISKEKNIVIQAMDADKLAGEEHVRFAVEKAINSFKTGANIANDLSKEILLYAAGTRQIAKAVKLGIHKGQNNVALVAVGDAPDLSGLVEIEPEHVLAYNDSKKEAIMKIFGITNEEIEAVGEDKIPELVIERVALQDVLK